MSKLGVGRYLRLLSVMEIAFTALFVVPATMTLGFYYRVLLLRWCDRDQAVARSFEGQSVYPDRTALDRRFHSGSLDFFPTYIHGDVRCHTCLPNRRKSRLKNCHNRLAG